MNDSNIPAKIALPFANAGTKNTIPVASQIGVTPGAASFTDGFPPLTMTPLASGGVPPAGADFNGILNELSEVLQWESAGGVFPYDAAFATAISGYPKGAILVKSGFNGFWQNMVDGNTTNPDTGGANWADAGTGKLLNIQRFTASGTYTPTPGTTYVVVEVVAGGGGGGATNATAAGQNAIASAGGAGGYGKGRFTSGFTGGIAVTIGAGGAGGTGSGSSGGTGGTTSFGSIASASGGIGGPFGGNTTSTQYAAGGALGGNAIVGGTLESSVGAGGGVGIASPGGNIGGVGGMSLFGAGPNGSVCTPSTATPGATANLTNFGAGATGGVAGASMASQNGGAGAPGVVIVSEYSI